MAAYLAALLWMLPAAFALPSQAGVAVADGTLWRGGATLLDGSRLEWRWAPLRSLARLGFATDWTLHGRGTDLAGRAVGRGGGVTVEAAEGRAAGSLLAVVAPDLPFACDLPLRIAFGDTGYGAPGSAGLIRTAPGLCAAKAGGGATPVPALAVALTRGADGTAFRIAPVGQPRRTLATGTLTAAGGLALAVTPAGAAALPFAAPAP